MENLRNNHERGEYLPAGNEQKLALLAQIYRIAMFDGGEAHPDDDIELRGARGYHGQAFGPAGEMTCSVLDTADPDGIHVFDDSDRVNVATLRINGRSYDFFAVIDRNEPGYKYESLAEALHRLAYPEVDYSHKPDASFDLKEHIGFMPGFDAQHLEVYMDLPSEQLLETTGELEPGPKLSDFLGAVAMGDRERVARLSSEGTPAPSEGVDSDTLRNIEISLQDEVGAAEVQRLLEMLTNDYFAVTVNSY